MTLGMTLTGVITGAGAVVIITIPGVIHTMAVVVVSIVGDTTAGGTIMAAFAEVITMAITTVIGMVTATVIMTDTIMVTIMDGIRLTGMAITITDHVTATPCLINRAIIP